MKHRVLAAACLIPVGPAVVLGQPEPSGRAVAVEANRRASGFGDLSANLRMVIHGGSGAERLRLMTVAILEVADGAERTLVRLEAPPDVRGTAFLTVSRADGTADQWLYLPAMRRTKRIVAANRSASFLGSEFTYEDLATMNVDQYEYGLVAADTLDSFPAWIVERRPKDASSQYGRHQVWFDQREYRVLKIDFYDRRDALLKTLRVRDFRLYAGRYWRPTHMEMVNHQSGASTRLDWTDYLLSAGLVPGDFEPGRLPKGR